MAVTLTEKAAGRVRNFMSARANVIALRLGVKARGCSGSSYVVDFADAIGPEDEVFESQGIKIVIDRVALLQLDGTEIDYGREGLSEGFRFHNPNEKARCGCGESFTV